MTDKEKLEKVRAEIERRYKYNKEHENDWAGTNYYWQKKEDEEILSFIGSMQEKSKECMYSKDNYTDEDRKALCDGCEEECEFNKKEEPVSEEQVKESAKIQHDKETCKENGDSLTQEPASEDLEAAGKEWLKPQLDKSYANYGEAKMMELTHFDGYAILDAIEFGANWQKEQIMKDAVEARFTLLDGFCIDRELYKNYEVGKKYKLIIIKED